MSKDSEGQIRLTLTIPKNSAMMALMVPEETELLVTIETLGSLHGFASEAAAVEEDPVSALEKLPTA